MIGNMINDLMLNPTPEADSANPTDTSVQPAGVSSYVNGDRPQKNEEPNDELIIPTKGKAPVAPTAPDSKDKVAEALKFASSKFKQPSAPMQQALPLPQMQSTPQFNNLVPQVPQMPQAPAINIGAFPQPQSPQPAMSPMGAVSDILTKSKIRAADKYMNVMLNNVYKNIINKRVK